MCLLGRVLAQQLRTLPSPQWKHKGRHLFLLDRIDTGTWSSLVHPGSFESAQSLTPFEKLQQVMSILLSPYACLCGHLSYRQSQAVLGLVASEITTLKRRSKVKQVEWMAPWQQHELWRKISYKCSKCQKWQNKEISETCEMVPKFAPQPCCGANIDAASAVSASTMDHLPLLHEALSSKRTLGCSR